ncbi:MAG TPA: DNA ligase D [Nitrososphaeraceae archaeon]|jgi:bifunctional non-homologous end joining protein LigD
MSLNQYKKKRKFSSTPEPAGSFRKIKKIDVKRNAHRKSKAFVVQKHRASHLHYDLRLEDENGALKSWAVPKGPTLDPKVKRLAMLVEDHPYDYLLFEGTIPKGNYGAGTVIVWDTGTYKSDRKLLDQFKVGKISFELKGKKLHGGFTLVRTKNENQWLLIKYNDEHAVIEDDLTASNPYSVLSGKTNHDLEQDVRTLPTTSTRVNLQPKSRKTSSNLATSTSTKKILNWEDERIQKTPNYKLPSKVRPMLAYPVDKAFDNKDWVFEVKWDGVRAIAFKENGKKVRIQSRNGNDITQKYPEISDALGLLPTNIKSVVFDGEIVVLDDKGYPDFQGHQHRMHVTDIQEIASLSKEIPATYYLFDILHYDGQDLKSKSYLERRKILSELVRISDMLKISDFVEEKGREMLRHTIRFNLEGIVAKRKSSRYFEGRRSREWLKIKNIRTQDCVVVGYTQGEGNRENVFGSLLLAVYNPADKSYQFVGHVGSGFDYDTLQEIYSMLQNIRANTMPVKYLPYKNRATTWVKPVLVTEIKFSRWTDEDIMRAPIFLRFRNDKSPEDCILAADQPVPTESVLDETIKEEDKDNAKGISKRERIMTHIKGRRSKSFPNGTSNGSSKVPSLTKDFSNLDKIYWPALGNSKPITKGELISYYDLVSNLILPHLRDRPLSLSRYPDGIHGKSFYHKDWDQSKPTEVNTVKVYSEERNDVINYLVCNNVESLQWIANLGSIEMHPWYSRFMDFEHCKTFELLYEEKCGLNFPDFIVLDLDPYIYSGKEKARAEPEYNLKGFRAATEVALDLKDILDQLNIISYVKASGKTGLHIYIPIVSKYSYNQTRSFAEILGKILLSKFPSKVTMEWSTVKRKGKVFFDYNQNSRGKTIASVYSVRPTPHATVSVPLKWNDLVDFDPRDFTLRTVPEIFKGKKDPWMGVLDKKQDISAIIMAAKELV